METIDLSRLNPVGFERLVRALSFRILGPGGVVYSAGPDGARDFTFDGNIKGYEGKKWNGYLVLQAKFREKAQTGDAVEWLKRQLDLEFKKYKDSSSRLKAPTYYILATNVHLSGADGKSSRRTRSHSKLRKGGYSKTIDLFEAWKQELGLKDVDIWSADKIIDLLVSFPDIRQAYAAWVTPGDVLAKVLEHFESVRVDFRSAISRSLRILLHRDQNVRLKDAGSVRDAQIRTSQVFVDLPLILADHQSHSNKPHQQAKDESGQDGKPRVFDNAVAKLVDRAREKLDPETLLDEDRPASHGRRPTRNRVVLMGGPGQGKSTTSLFLTQIFRAAILETDPATRRDHNILRLVPEILGRAEGEGISRNVPHRYPLHISLPRFADSISHARQKGQKGPSLLAHIASEISESCDQEVDRADVRNWLRRHPWLLVLDGLDEVPPTGERPTLIQGISNFFSEVSDANADVLVVVTTRPQGYNQDLDEKLWEHWRLAELTPAQALTYAKAFGEARYPEDRHRREDVHALLSKAAQQPATARLMVSPLQVTILHFIVDTGGGVPTARWTLFNEYFEVLKRREKAKGGETQKVLERHWQQIGPIHHRAGLLLQTDSEHAGGAGGRLSHERFRALVRNYLTSEGFAGGDLQARISELTGLALHRLVLLSTQEEGFIRFDVRSLQEFMAAAAITSGDEEIMEERLGHIAAKSHWRHVFLIAASRCFADDSFHYRRATIIALPRQIDSVEPDMLVRNGAKLSLELLADGIGLDHPYSRRPLLQHALELLSLGPSTFIKQMAEVWDPGCSDLIETVLTERIVEGSSPPALAAWKLLFEFAQLNHAWANGLIVRLWPDSLELSINALRHVALPFTNQDVVSNVARTIADAGPIKALSRLYTLLHSEVQLGANESTLDYSAIRSLNVVRYRIESEKRGQNYFLIPEEFGPSLTVRVRTLDDHYPLDNFRSVEMRGGWTTLRVVADFCSKPTPRNLASSLKTIVETGNLLTAKELLFAMPWPMACLIDEAHSGQELAGIAEDVDNGMRGTAKQWRAAEKRWRESGISRADLRGLASGSWFGRDVGVIGAPFWSSFDVHEPNLSISLELISIGGNIPNLNLKERIFDCARFVLFESPKAETLEQAARLMTLFMPSNADASLHNYFVYPEWMVALGEEVWTVSEFVKQLAVIGSRCPFEIGTELNLVKPLIGAFNRFPNERALLYPMLASMLGYEDRFELMSSLHDDAFRVYLGDPPLISAVVSLFRLQVGRFDSSIECCVSELISEGPPFRALDLAFGVLAREAVPLDMRIGIMAGLINSLREISSVEMRACVEPLRRTLDARKSALTDRRVWIDKLNLPADAFELLLPIQLDVQKGES